MKKVRENSLDRVFDLYQSGYTSHQIANILYIDVNSVLKKIRDLNDVTKSCYDPQKYNELIFQNHINKQNGNSLIIDKDILSEITDLMLNGYLMIEIAVSLGMLESQVKTYLEYLKKVNNPFCDETLYEECMQKQKSVLAMDEDSLYARLRILEQKIFPKTLKEYSNSSLVLSYAKRKQNEDIVKDYLASGKTISEQKLATKYGLSTSTIRDILRGKDKYRTILNYLSEEELQEEKQNREQKIQENKERIKKNFQFVSNNACISEHEKRVKNNLYINSLFWLQVIFTYRLTIEEIAQLLNYSSLDVLNDLLFQIASQYNLESSLIYLFSNTSSDVHHFTAAKLFVRDVFAAKKEGQKEELKNLLTQINDTEYYQIIRKNLTFDKLTDEEKMVVLKYCLKYSVLARHMPYNRERLENFCPEELKEEYHAIMEFNQCLGRSKYARLQRMQKQIGERSSFIVKQFKR